MLFFSWNRLKIYLSILIHSSITHSVVLGKTELSKVPSNVKLIVEFMIEAKANEQKQPDHLAEIHVMDRLHYV